MSREDDAAGVIRGQAEAFNLWQLPSFDHPELEPEEPLQDDSAELPDEGVDLDDEALEELQPLTLEELEHIRHEAYQEAYNEGFATGEKEGFHSGQLKASQEAERILTERLKGLERLMQQLFEPIAQQDQALELALLDLLKHLVREVIQRELVMDSSQITQVVREALKLLPMGADAICIYLNPVDFAQIKALRARHEESWRILEDESLMPGGCRVETEHSRIDASIETRTARLMAQLLDQQQDHLTHPIASDLHIDLDRASEDAP